jgi:hypothetical protein
VQRSFAVCSNRPALDGPAVIDQAREEGDGPAHAVAFLQVLIGDQAAKLRQRQEIAWAAVSSDCKCGEFREIMRP